MNTVTGRLQHLFIVRIWQEPSEDTPPGEWRGSVEHIPSGQRLYFAALNDLNNFLNQHLYGLAALPDTTQANSNIDTSVHH